MTDRWVVWAGTVVAAVMLLGLGERWWAVSVVALGGFVSSRLGPPQFALDPLRDFPEDIRSDVFEAARGRCQWPGCGVQMHRESDCPLGGCDFDYNTDHIIAHANGGRTVRENAQALCRRHNLLKSNH